MSLTGRWRENDWWRRMRSRRRRFSAERRTKVRPMKCMVGAPFGLLVEERKTEGLLQRCVLGCGGRNERGAQKYGLRDIEHRFDLVEECLPCMRGERVDPPQ